MGCPALGIWVAFLKQPDALPGRFFFEEFFLGGALPGSAGCFKKPTQIPNAGHPI
jgi:hypothetical protein